MICLTSVPFIDKYSKKIFQSNKKMVYDILLDTAEILQYTTESSRRKGLGSPVKPDNDVDFCVLA